MTGLEKDPPAKAQFFQLPLDLIEYILSLHLTGTQHDLLLLLWKLDPYGNKFIDIPNPQELAITLKVNARTVERAAQRLVDCELFEFQIERWKARNRNGSNSLSDFYSDKEIQMPTKRSKYRQKDPNVETGISLSEENKTSHLQSAQSNNLGNGHVPITNKNLLEQTEFGASTIPTLNREGIGTSLQAIEEAGIRINKTIEAEINKLIQSQGEAAVVTEIRNAISAVEEQQEEGNLKNPGGFSLQRSEVNTHPTERSDKQNKRIKLKVRPPQT